MMHGQINIKFYRRILLDVAVNVASYCIVQLLGVILLFSFLNTPKIKM